MTTIITDRERAKDALIESLSREVESLVARLAAPPAQPAPLRDPLVVIRKRPGKTPCGECHLQAGEVCDICGAAQPARQLVSVSCIDIERMIAECLPGGHSCDPQQVADAIRQYCNAAQPAQRLSFVQATAPRAIWLQVSDEADDNKEAFPDDHEGITWCQDSALMCEVKYVRADLAAQPAQAQPARLSDGDIARHWFATTEEDEIWPSVVKFAHAIAAAAVPPGFVVVPEEPTEAMRKAGDDTNAVHIYRAMIAAAKATK